MKKVKNEVAIVDGGSGVRASSTPPLI